ncbi:MAG TPA: hypothetical protein VNT75_16965 [Symbiobacteriaceae bacterium]|nr:hypothetical protein [Symbiobacteriaceae bacterium]
MVRSLVAGALRGISHPNTDLDAQTFLLRVRAIRTALLGKPDFPVAYRPQVTAADLDDPQVLVWDIGRSHDPERANFDHHQDHQLGATPIILLQALGAEPAPLDRYVDLADRGFFFKHPQPHPFLETLHGFSSGISLLHADDETRSRHYQDLLGWVEAAGLDPFGRFREQDLPERFRPFLRARRAEEEEARRAADFARWLMTPIGKVAYIASDVVGVMRVLYEQGAALVVLHEPQGRMSGWSRPAPKFTVGANPALVAVPERLDLRPLFARFSALEPTGHTWGGQAGIGGSPREDGGSGLTADQVLRELRTFLG